MFKGIRQVLALVAIVVFGGVSQAQATFITNQNQLTRQ